MAKIEIKLEAAQVGRLNKLRQSSLVGDTYEAAVEAAILAWEIEHGALGGYAISMDDISDAYGTVPGASKYNELCDLSGDRKISSVDQGIARAINIPEHDVVAPPTATSTVLDELIKAVNATPHEGLCNGSQGYDWEFYGGTRSWPTTTYKGVAGWGSFQENRNGNPGGLTIETRNYQLHALVGGRWVKLPAQTFYGSQVHSDPPHEGGVSGSMGAGPNFTMPGHGMGSQFFQGQTAIPSGATGFVSFCEIKLPDSAPANTNLLVNTGIDTWPAAGSSSGNNDAAVGRYRIPIKGSWKWIGSSSMPESVLRAAGSPL